MYSSFIKPTIFVVFILLIFTSCKDNTADFGDNLKGPNIVWLVAEDQSPDWFPMYGDSTVYLPHLEALSKDGITFTNAVAPVPVCAPARSAIITGMYPTTLGTHNMRTYNAYAKGENEPSLGLPSYSPIVPEGVRMFTEYLRKQGYYTSNGPKEDYNFEKTDAAWDESSKDHHWRNRKEGQPFFSVFNFSVCHESQVWARTNDSIFVSPDEVRVPPFFPDNEVIRHDLAVNYSNLVRLDKQIGEIITALKEDGLYENTIIFFYGDHGGPFPRYKRALYDTGLKVPMVIKFPKGQQAGTYDQRIISFIDLAPTVLSLAGIAAPKVMQGVAHFGAFKVHNTPKVSYHSSDRFDEIYDRRRAVRSARFKYIKNFNTEVSRALPVSYREQMAMMKELRRLDSVKELSDLPSIWIHPTKPVEELYDLLNDPNELNNLAGTKEYQDSLHYYRNLLKSWIKESKDLGEVNEKELVSHWLKEGRPQQLPSLEMELTPKGIVLISPKKDATIVWRTLGESTWNLYTEPLSREAQYEVKAERIGYMDSEVVVIE